MNKLSILAIVLLVVTIIPNFAFADYETSAAMVVSLVNQDPDPASAGDLVEVRLSFTNEGGEALNNIMVEIEPEYPFELVSESDAIQEIETLNAYQGTNTDHTKILKFKLRVDQDATAGEYNLKVKTYEEGNSATITRNIPIVVDSTDNAEIIYIDKTVIIPGRQENLTFTINNVGSSPLKDIAFSWVNEDKIILPVGSDNTKYVSSIGVGESADVTYTIIADTDVDAGLYELELELKYEASSNRTSTINTIAGVYIGGETDFDIAFSESSDDTTSFTIANIGSNPASSVSVVIPEQDSWTTSGTNSMIIGNLETGDYTVASFSLESISTRAVMPTQTDSDSTEDMTMPTAQQNNNLIVQIKYTDTMGNRITLEKEVAMSSSSVSSSTVSSEDFAAMGRPGGMRNQQSSFSTYKWYIFGLVAVVAFIVVFRMYKKRKLDEPKLTKMQFIKTMFKKK